MPAGQKSRLWGSLHMLHLGSEEPARLAGFYGGAMGMKVSARGTALACRGPGRRMFISPGANKELKAAGYRVADGDQLDALARRLADAGVAAQRIDAPFFQPGALGFKDPDGNQFIFGLAEEDHDAGEGLPARLQHFGLATTDVVRQERFFVDVVGLRESDQVFDDQGGLRTFFVRADNEHHCLAIFQASSNRFDHHCYEAGDWM